MKRASVVGGGKETTEPADVHKAEGYAGNTISMIPWERRIHGIKKNEKWMEG